MPRLSKRRGFTTKRVERRVRVRMRSVVASAGSKAFRGFTLIELLVVIAIIALLSSIILASLNNARNKAYDAKRITDLVSIATALELYYGANNSYPPSLGPGWWGSQCVAWGGYAANNVIPGLVPNYIGSIPSDPQMNATGNTCCYIYASTGPDYKLLAHNCPTSIACYGAGEATGGFADPVRPTYACQISTAGAAAW